jgi:DNA-binding response OmpR family regulator
MATTQSCRVLVVEDDPTIVANLVEYLEMQGHGVDVAYDGAAAMSRVAANTYDVIVLDLGLPRADGLQVLGRGDAGAGTDRTRCAGEQTGKLHRRRR